MKETFQIVSVKDGKQDFAAIFHVFQEMKAGRLKNDLRLVNYYHEVPISYPASIDGVEKDTIELSVHQAQSVVLNIQKQVLIKSAAFPQGLGVHAIVEMVNIKNSFAVLGRFAYASIRADRRGAVRVVVEKKAKSEFVADGQSIAGWLRDISLTGFAMESSEAAPVGLAEEGTARLNLEGIALSVPARLVGSRQIDTDYLHTFQIDVDKHADKLISQYIYNRQVDIIRSLKDQFG